MNILIILKLRLFIAYQSFRLPENLLLEKRLLPIKDFEELIRLYEKDEKILTYKEYTEMLFHLGEGYERLGMNDEANSVCNKLLQKNPSINERKERDRTF